MKNLNNMASELLEYEDEDEGNDHSNAGSKKTTPPSSIQSLEKREYGLGLANGSIGVS
jgi:hypothetical protein